MNLKNLKDFLVDRGCNQLFFKSLSPNDNSKNQVYLGGSFEVLNILPISNIATEEAGDWERERFKALLNFFWITEDGKISKAPHAQLILYPKYPEVRFSGFLKGSEFPPSDLMTMRLADRILFFSVSNKGEVLGYVAHPDSVIAKEVSKELTFKEHGIFSVIELNVEKDNRGLLLSELDRINKRGWIESKRLNSEGEILPCLSSNCGGYTLEAELGVTPNGFSEPDFLGWEIKQFGVRSFQRIQSSVITLMTPEPTNGLYKTDGVELFVRTYGYNDKRGREDRMNFGGIHRSNSIHPTTNLKLMLIGYDPITKRIRNSNGKIALIDNKDNEAASWSFSSLLLHWNRKHNRACYVPSMSERRDVLSYKFGNKIFLGLGTDFLLFLSQMDDGNIYYDPGIKLENISSKPKVKKRSQFRVKSRYLPLLYKSSELIDLNCISGK